LTLDYLRDSIPLPNYFGDAIPPHPPFTTPLIVRSSSDLINNIVLMRNEKLSRL
jgi:hypothetical protein